MARVLVVHHEADLADEMAASLRRAGHVVEECAGPNFGPCPVLSGDDCPAVADAEVIVYDVWSSGSSETERALMEALREMYPDLPMVLIAPGLEFDWIDGLDGAPVVALTGSPSGAPLREAVERALGRAQAAV
jgi:hypothetical protein